MGDIKTSRVHYISIYTKNNKCTNHFQNVEKKAEGRILVQHINDSLYLYVTLCYSVSEHEEPKKKNEKINNQIEISNCEK